MYISWHMRWSFWHHTSFTYRAVLIYQTYCISKKLNFLSSSCYNIIYPLSLKHKKGKKTCRTRRHFNKKRNSPLFIVGIVVFKPQVCANLLSFLLPEAKMTLLSPWYCVQSHEHKRKTDAQNTTSRWYSSCQLCEDTGSVGRVPSVHFTPPPPLSAPNSLSSLSRRISLCRYYGDTNAIDASAGWTCSACIK